jgi:hypothetical protein
MDRDIKSRGRKKRVTSGGGNVKRRGKGVNTSKPVGSSGGYTQAKHGSSSSGNQTAPQGSHRAGSGGLNIKKILIIAVVVIVGYFILKNMGLFSMDSLMTAPAGGDNVYTEQPASQVEPNQSQSQLNLTVSKDARKKHTVIKGDGKDVYTIMIYMCGTDLESRSGMATADLNEMLNSEISDNLNIIIETGGTKTWKNNVISSKTNQRYQVTSEGLRLLEGDLGKRAMTDDKTLTDFIKYSKKSFPADRYSLILWDHGGGSNQGYGYDEYVPNTTMTLDEIDTALSEANCTFDFVGFDACLMATYETAMMLDKHADYLIASEETEPGIGWYYTNWISELSQNTSMSTLEIGQNIIDDFIRKCYEHSPRDKTTLSIVDISELSGTAPSAFKSFATSTSALIDSDDYKLVADARGGTKEFGQAGRLDQIDLVHLAQNIDTPEADQLVDVLTQAVKYNKTSNTIANANGLSIYFPYSKLSALGPMLSTYDEIGMDEEYADCIKNFANLEVGGQAVSSGSSTALESLLGSLGQTAPANPPSISGGGGGAGLIGSLLGSFITGGGLESIIGSVTGGGDTSSDWVDTDSMMNETEFYSENRIDEDDISLTQKDDAYVLSLDDKKWDLIQTISLNVFFDDGDGFIDLGLDNVYEFDNDGDLKIDYDGTWLAINGQVVSYYLVSEDETSGDYIITGRVPAMLNDERVDLILVFNDANPYGNVIGAQYIYEDSPDTIAKGLIEIKNGDTLDFLCDYYTYDDTFDDSYFIGEQMVVEGELIISNVSVGDNKCRITYQLKDMYNNTYWTPALLYQE